MEKKKLALISVATCLFLVCGNAYSQAPLNELAEYYLEDRAVSSLQAYKVAVLTDTHIGWMPFAGSHLETMLDQFDAWEGTSNEIAFVIVTGDFIHSYCEESIEDYYYNVADYMNDTRIPVFQVVGNHELGSREIGDDGDLCDWMSPSQTTDSYFYYIGDPDYYIDFFLDRFVITDNADFLVSSSDVYDWCSLDSIFHGVCGFEDLALSASYWPSPLGDRFSILDNQLDLVETRLMASKRFELAFVHIPVVPDYDDNGKVDLDAYADYRSLLHEYEVSAVFNGHVHSWSKLDEWYSRTGHIWHVRGNDNQTGATPSWTRVVFTSHIGAPSPKILATFCTNAACTTTNGGTWEIDRL